jgi:hypothetical protein
VDLTVRNDKQALTIACNLVTFPSALSGRNYAVTAVCTDNSSNEAPILNGLQKFSLQRQGTPPTIRILCVAHTANLALGDFATESRAASSATPEDFLLHSLTTLAPHFSDIPRLREERWCSLGDIANYIMIHWTQVIGCLKEN